jgi:hypothetical protein
MSKQKEKKRYFEKWIFFSIQSSYKPFSGLLILLGLIHTSKDTHKCYLSMAYFFVQGGVCNIVFSCGRKKVCCFGQI